MNSRFSTMLTYCDTYVVTESDTRYGAYNFYEEQAQAPEDLRALTDLHESLPFRRRGYERDAMLRAMIDRANYRGLFEQAQDQLENAPRSPALADSPIS